MDKETKKSLDNLVKQLQASVCIEKDKVGKPNHKKIIDYLKIIYIINEEFKTNYSIKSQNYNITSLPLKN